VLYWVITQRVVIVVAVAVVVVVVVEVSVVDTRCVITQKRAVLSYFAAEA